MTPPTAEQIQQAWDDPKLANLLYHDWEADTYDDKWSISFDERCITYATDRFRNVAGEEAWPYGSALELGCGTGFFLLNLKLGGVLDEGHVTDLSPGMVDVAKRNGAHLGFDVEGRVADAETLPYPDESFDLVIGHAVLHHIPDLDQAMREVLRVLKPGGRFVFAGEPTAKGDIVARRLSHADVERRQTDHPPARPAGQVRPAGCRTRRVVARSRARGGGRHPHLRPGRTAAAVRARGCHRRRHRHRGADRVLVRLAGAHGRGRGQARVAGLEVGLLRLRDLAGPVGAGRARS